jgi:hypothetical protein
MLSYNAKTLLAFLDHIGPQNASFLRHICIAFPAFVDYHLGSVALKEDSIRTLEHIRDKLHESCHTRNVATFPDDQYNGVRHRCARQSSGCRAGACRRALQGYLVAERDHCQCIR